MPLTLMYITNRPQVAQLAQRCGVDRIFVDMEYLGKAARQGGLDTVQSHHTPADIVQIKQAIAGGPSRLLVRLNPIHEAGADCGSSEEEIDTAIQCGADLVMLPMFTTPHEVERCVSAVDGRAKIVLLLETPGAVARLGEILSVGGFDEIHVGINDLHLAYKKTFMFELYIDGTLDRICQTMRERDVRFGIGGIARIGHGLLPAEYIIAEHYRLGSRMAILSRSFCDANTAVDMAPLEALFMEGIRHIRAFEAKAAQFQEDEFAHNHGSMERRILEIVRNRA